MRDDDLWQLVKAKYEAQGFQFNPEDEIRIHDHESGGVHIGLYGSPWGGKGGGFELVVRPEDLVSYYWSVIINNKHQGRGYGKRLYHVGEEICRELGIDLIVHTTVLEPGFLEKMGCHKLSEAEKVCFAGRLHGIDFDEKSDPYYQILS